MKLTDALLNISQVAFDYAVSTGIAKEKIQIFSLVVHANETIFSGKATKDEMMDVMLNLNINNKLLVEIEGE